MMPVVDYGGIAIVVAKISAVSGVIDDNGKFFFEVHLSGNVKPIAVMFDSRDIALENREELLEIISRYYYLMEYGPDFDPDNVEDMISDEGEDIDAENDDGDMGEKH